jgi:protocatechuate 3,4-dioxygenase beta subunit
VDEKLFRSDLRADPSTGVARQGLPLTLAITGIDSISGNCVPLSGTWIDLWHCGAIGIYSDESTYNPGEGTCNVSTTGQKFLRGYQITDANGQVNFTTIYPGWYAGPRHSYPRADTHLDNYQLHD